MASSGIPVKSGHVHLPAPNIVRPQTGPRSLVPLLPALLMFYAALLPQEVRLSIAGQVIYSFRAVSLLMLPWLINSISRGRYPFRGADLFIFAAIGWMMISFCAFYGLGEGFSRAIGLVLDVITPYLIARLSIRSYADFRRFLVYIAPGLLAAGLSMMVESLTHRQLVRPLAASIFGPLPFFENGQAVAQAKDFNVIRLGLLRAAGPFSHPILAGLFMASFLPLFINSSLRGWPRKAGIVAGVMAVFSVSSAGFVSFAITGLLLGFERFKNNVSGIGWRTFIFTVFSFLLLLQVASQNGVVSIIVRYTLDPATGWFRQLIWEYGSRSVAKHPWFGIGLTDYERLSWMINSIDNHWLLLAIRHGYITPVALLLGCLIAMISLGQVVPHLSKVERKLGIAISVSLFGMVMLAFTTSYFGGTLTWFMMLIGIVMALGDRRILKSQSRAQKAE